MIGLVYISLSVLFGRCCEMRLGLGDPAPNFDYGRPRLQYTGVRNAIT